MRFLTPTETRLLADLPPSESVLVRGFFEELDARLVSEGESRPTPAGAPRPEGSLSSRVSVITPVPSETSQSALFPVRKERP